MARTHDNVGAAVSAVAKVSHVDDVDWMIGGWGDCRGLIARGIRREADKVARQFGYDGVAELERIVEERTSSRWVWFNFPRAGQEND